MTSMLRTPLVLPVAGAVTVGLFLMMRGLIDIGPVEPEEAPDPLEVVLSFEVAPVEPKPRIEIDEIPEVEAPPPIERIPVETGAPDGEFLNTRYELPPVDPSVTDIASNGTFSADGNPVPLVRIEPVYPARPAERGLEGQCMMIFDITPQGTTANVRALSCSNTGFEQSSINAVRRWRYSPQVENGQPTTFRGATTQLVYRLG